MQRENKKRSIQLYCSLTSRERGRGEEGVLHSRWVEGMSRLLHKGMESKCTCSNPTQSISLFLSMFLSVLFIPELHPCECIFKCPFNDMTLPITSFSHSLPVQHPYYEFLCVFRYTSSQPSNMKPTVNSHPCKLFRLSSSYQTFIVTTIPRLAWLLYVFQKSFGVFSPFPSFRKNNIHCSQTRHNPKSTDFHDGICDAEKSYLERFGICNSTALFGEYFLWISVSNALWILLEWLSYAFIKPVMHFFKGL